MRVFLLSITGVPVTKGARGGNDLGLSLHTSRGKYDQTSASRVQDQVPDGLSWLCLGVQFRGGKVKYLEYLEASGMYHLHIKAILTVCAGVGVGGSEGNDGGGPREKEDTIDRQIRRGAARR